MAKNDDKINEKTLSRRNFNFVYIFFFFGSFSLCLSLSFWMRLANAFGKCCYPYSVRSFLFAFYFPFRRSLLFCLNVRFWWICVRRRLNEHNSEIKWKFLKWLSLSHFLSVGAPLRHNCGCILVQSANKNQATRRKISIKNHQQQQKRWQQQRKWRKKC